jgi:hypothetical protein
MPKYSKKLKKTIKKYKGGFDSEIGNPFKKGLRLGSGTNKEVFEFLNSKNFAVVNRKTTSKTFNKHLILEEIDFSTRLNMLIPGITTKVEIIPHGNREDLKKFVYLAEKAHKITSENCINFLDDGYEWVTGLYGRAKLINLDIKADNYGYLQNGNLTLLDVDPTRFAYIGTLLPDMDELPHHQHYLNYSIILLCFSMYILLPEIYQPITHAFCRKHNFFRKDYLETVQFFRLLDESQLSTRLSMFLRENNFTHSAESVDKRYFSPMEYIRAYRAPMVKKNIDYSKYLFP